MLKYSKLKAEKSDIKKFLYGFVVGVAITSIVSFIVVHLLGNDEENTVDKRRMFTGLSNFVKIAHH